MRRDARLGRIGLTLFAALLVAAAAIFMLGEQTFLFTRTNDYYVLFPTVLGLAEGNPVQLNGVEVGRIESIVLPENIDEVQLRVWIAIERRYAERIREDSVARIKTLGLLGDKYISVTSGSPAYRRLDPGDQIPAEMPTDVEALLESGEDVVANIVETASSLSGILGRMERGEGLLGQLVVERPGAPSVADTLTETLESVQRVAARVEAGEGTIGRLVTDSSLADDVASTVDRLDRLIAGIEQGEGIAGALVADDEAAARFRDTLAGLESTAETLGALAEDLRDGDGLLPRLMSDEEYGKRVSAELLELLESLNLTVERITEGEGTVARLINDPAIYEALNDVVVGIDESKLLRWLVRNRQRKGIEVRYEETLEEVEAEGADDSND